ncbi:nuclear transport factor 2 family protein [Microbacterium sp.]|uniref:nuclear transport factor 2 family protein n=1 Tax=Microbacterium sp. TaxID=51671 RepID=UPI002811DE04|nr:nuclear transport factor 2 family protein [Microbacterium sp.]
MTALTETDLLALEREGWDSLCASRGAAFYGEIMTSDALMILVNGMILDRAGVKDSLDGAPPWATYSITHERLVPIAADAAALTYRATAHRDGEEPFEALMTSVYTVRDGRPRLALYQQTAAGDGPTD